MKNFSANLVKLGDFFFTPSLFNQVPKRRSVKGAETSGSRNVFYTGLETSCIRPNRHDYVIVN